MKIAHPQQVVSKVSRGRRIYYVTFGDVENAYQQSPYCIQSSLILYATLCVSPRIISGSEHSYGYHSVAGGCERLNA